jgi:hypothetical protein
MQVQTSDARNLKHFTRQDLAVSHHNNRIRLQRADFFDCLSIFDPLRLQDRDLGSGQRSLYRRRLDLLSAPHWLVRLADDSSELMLA